VRSPSVRAAPTKDLRAELNHRRAREDAPVSLERSDDLRAELNPALVRSPSVMATYFHIALSGRPGLGS
jgi:hypothetical protein